MQVRRLSVVGGTEGAFMKDVDSKRARRLLSPSRWNAFFVPLFDSFTWKEAQKIAHSSPGYTHFYFYLYPSTLQRRFRITKCQIWPGRPHHHNEIFIDGLLCFHISGDAACRIFALCALGLAYNLHRFAEKIQACHLYSVE